MKQKNCLYIDGSTLVFGNIPFHDEFLLGYSGSWLVGFDTERLNFAPKYATGFKIYPGGEYHDLEPVCFWQGDLNDHRPRRLQANKKEIWEIRPGAEIYVADRHGGLRVLRVSLSGTPSFEVPKPIEISRYLRIRANAMLKRKSVCGLKWVRESLWAIHQAYRQEKILELHAEVCSLKT